MCEAPHGRAYGDARTGLSHRPPVRLSAYPPAAQCVREMLWAAARGGRTRAAACWLHCRPVLLWLQVSLSEWPAVAKYNQVVSNRPASNDYAKGTPCAAVLPVEYPELTTIHADSTVREYTSRASVTREGMHCGIAYTRCSVSWHCAVTYIHGVARRFARSSCVSLSGSWGGSHDCSRSHGLHSHGLPRCCCSGSRAPPR